MKVHRHIPFLAFLFILSQSVIHAQRNPVGSWVGTLSFGGMELRVVFHVERVTDTSLTARLDSPDQGATGIPALPPQLKGDSVHIGVPSVLGRFTGTFVSDSVIEGTWTQGGVSLPLVLKRNSTSIVVKRPQEPKPPFPYSEREVTCRNEKDGVSIACTLTVPVGIGPFPAVVLISGSGPQDRDETIFNHKPFLVLADHLTREGIAVLRCDDRGVGKSTGSREHATTEDFTSDVLAAVHYLKSLPEIDAGKIGLIGHSEGGLIAPLAASRSRDVAFIVLLAGPGLPGEDILFMQGELIRRASGTDESSIRKQAELQRRIFDIVKTETDTARAHAAMVRAVDEFLQSLSEEERRMPEFSRDIVHGSLRSVNTPWFRFFLTYDPRPVLRKLRIPVLALFGEKDLQVPPRENLAEVEKALREGGNTRWSAKILPGLNHLFQTAETGNVSEYARIEETFAPAALREISTWIRSVVGH
ncbi:MAG: alpha/beta fold hydrolase [Bacteroidota bacterium]|nr:alpha/beta fold hydrolase [Bacteroidota bacterium]